jgi:hypothetical protein
MMMIVPEGLGRTTVWQHAPDELSKVFAVFMCMAVQCRLGMEPVTYGTAWKRELKEGLEFGLISLAFLHF